ncbi:thioredoxin-like protein [Auriculariales sp. MPI-PUGE-AT-0066]|nr:thioredoxin-like protein [Auriculariales sp. MPI-PUGE-AT-0066]
MLARVVLQRSTLRVARSPVFRRFLSDDVRQRLDGVVKGHPLVLFMKGQPSAPQCGFSRAVVQILQLHGVPEEKMAALNVLEDSVLREGIKEYSQWPTIPQLYVDGEFIGGCDIVLDSECSALAACLQSTDACLVHQTGKLEELLAKHSIIEPLPTEEANAGSR